MEIVASSLLLIIKLINSNNYINYIRMKYAN